MMMRPDGMPGSCVCLQTSTICSRRSTRHQIRGNNIKWHSHVDYIIIKYYQGQGAACNYQGRHWNQQKIMWSKHSSTAWWNNQLSRQELQLSLFIDAIYNKLVFQLRTLSRLCMTNCIPLSLSSPSPFSCHLFPSLNTVFSPCHNLSPQGSRAHAVQ